MTRTTTPRVPTAFRFEPNERFLLFDTGIHQFASKAYVWSLAFRLSVPACALPVLFPGIAVQNTLA